MKAANTYLESIIKQLNNEKAVLMYFGTTSCSVVEAFEPKIKTLLKIEFPKMRFLKIDINEMPMAAAHFQAFVEPTVLIFFEGKEAIRRSRTISISELETTIKRLYTLIFN